MNRKPAIISLSSIKLTQKEKKLLIQEKPWGVILFKRNIHTFNQTKKLIQEIRNCLKDKK